MHRVTSTLVGMLTVGIVHTVAIVSVAACPPERGVSLNNGRVAFGRTAQRENLELDPQSIRRNGYTVSFIYYVNGRRNVASTNCQESAWWVRGVQIPVTSNAAKGLLNYVCSPQISDFL